MNFDRLNDGDTIVLRRSRIKDQSVRVVTGTGQYDFVVVDGPDVKTTPQIPLEVGCKVKSRDSNIGGKVIAVHGPFIWFDTGCGNSPVTGTTKNFEVVGSASNPENIANGDLVTFRSILFRVHDIRGSHASIIQVGSTVQNSVRISDLTKVKGLKKGDKVTHKHGGGTFEVVTVDGDKVWCRNLYNSLKDQVYDLSDLL